MANMAMRREKILREKDLKKTMEGIIIDNIKKNSKKRKFRGGVIIERSNCCDAPIIYTSGGVQIQKCSKCRKTIHPTVIR